jgi:tryptophan synthase alpha chain
VIQASYTRALGKGIHLDDVFAMCRQTMPALAAPVVTMVSYAIVYRRGPQRYVQEAQAAGIAGAIVPDLPVEESVELARICRAADFSLIQLVTPTTPRERGVKIAETSSGFIYYVSVAGITGERSQLPEQLLENVAWLRSQTPLPVCIGFGISRPEHVRLLAPVADGLIVGSAIVRRIAEAGSQSPQTVLQNVGDYVSELIAALHSVR